MGYESYADVADADIYLGAKFNSSAWFALTDEVKGQALVTASRLFDRTCWQGTPTGVSPQVLAWPRTGITGVDDQTIPDVIVNGSIELAFYLATGSTVEVNATPGAQVLQVIKAGSVMLQYFRGAESLNAQRDRFPLPVMELVGSYLCGAGVNIVGIASGSSSGTSDGDTSVTGDNFGFNDGI
jgi:hypothetical protein